jgi:hypothetical protein
MRNHLQEADLVEHKGYQIRFSRSGLGWMVFVTLPHQHPSLIRVPNRNAAIAKAQEWIEAQLASAKDPA